MKRTGIERLVERVRKQSVRHGASRAYTLLEVMLVLGILAVMAGVSWPMLMSPWSRSLAQEAAQDLTQQLLEARRRSVEVSRVYRLRWQQGSGAYEIVAPGVAEEQATDTSMSLRSAIPDSLGSPSSNIRDIGVTGPDGQSSISGQGDPRMAGANISPPRPVQPLDLHTSLPHAITFGRPPQFAEVIDNVLSQSAQRVIEPGDAANSVATNGAAAGNEAGESSEKPVELPWSDPVWFYPDGRTSNGHWTLVSEEGYEIDVYLRGLTGTVRVSPVRRSLLPESGIEGEIPGDVPGEVPRDAAGDTLREERM